MMGEAIAFEKLMDITCGLTGAFKNMLETVIESWCSSLPPMNMEYILSAKGVTESPIARHISAKVPAARLRSLFFLPGMSWMWS